MKNLKIASIALVLQLGFIGYSATAFGQTNTKQCTIHVLTQGGSPTATTVKVCN